MRTIFVGLAGLSVFVMTAIALWGAGTLPSSARVPLHLGLGGYGNYVGRTLGLVAWPLIGVVAFALGLLPSRENGGEAAALIMLALMVVLPFIQYGAIRSAELGSDRTRRR